MTTILRNEIEKLKKHILSLCAVVEGNVRKAMTATESRDPVLAKQVVGADSEVDQMEVDLEEDCLKILALHQPLAMDLRFIVAVMKITNDLGRSMVMSKRP